jgi:hypothetical protein
MLTRQIASLRGLTGYGLYVAFAENFVTGYSKKQTLNTGFLKSHSCQIWPLQLIKELKERDLKIV